MVVGAEEITVEIARWVAEGGDANIPGRSLNAVAAETQKCRLVTCAPFDVDRPHRMADASGRHMFPGMVRSRSSALDSWRQR